MVHYDMGRHVLDKLRRFRNTHPLQNHQPTGGKLMENIWYEVEINVNNVWQPWDGDQHATKDDAQNDATIWLGGRDFRIVKITETREVAE
jgi:hypothetical protein